MELFRLLENTQLTGSLSSNHSIQPIYNFLPQAFLAPLVVPYSISGYAGPKLILIFTLLSSVFLLSDVICKYLDMSEYVEPARWLSAFMVFSTPAILFNSSTLPKRLCRLQLYS